MKTLLAAAPRFLFFTGKGGVGKTSMACATAVALADAGRRVLLVSTDPASNLDEVLETPLGSTPRAVRGVERLAAFNIDPQAAAREYRERIVGPFRGVLPDATVSSIEEQLSGACTVEIASFNEFTRLIGDAEAVAEYDHVVLDTAPTGHTLRLLGLPAAWNDFIATNQTGTSCLGPLAGLKDQRLIYERAVEALTDAGRTLLVLVSRAETASMKEAARAGAELAALGIANQFFVVNGVFTATDRMDPIALAFEDKGRAALESMPSGLARLPRVLVPFHPTGFGGICSLRRMWTGETSQEAKTEAAVDELPTEDFASLIDHLAADGSGVIMTMGKGGVGKTTLAAAIAMELARRGFPVHLSTTDPAAHVADTVEGNFPGLQVSRIDPLAETEAYRRHVLATAGASLDEAARALLEEELRSPCTEEIAVFQAFARMVGQGKDRFVVLDTAPTGHTLLLLDASEAYHREVLRSSSDLPDAVRELLPRLRDPHYTRVVLVTLPEATPVHEAAHLQEDLRRAGIEPFAWAINQSFAAVELSDPLLRVRAARERRHIAEVVDGLATRTALIPWLGGDLTGARGLQELLQSAPLQSVIP